MWTGGHNTNSIVWVAELGEGRYLRLQENAGKLFVYEADVSPSETSLSKYWEELKP